VRLKDTQDTVWYKLKDLKESHPVEVAQYAIDNDLDEEDAFRWWVPFTIRKRNRLLKAMKKRYFRTDQMFGVECPKAVARALKIDEESGTTYWRDAINKEMSTVKKAFQILPEGSKPPPYHKFIKCHLSRPVHSNARQGLLLMEAG
jgi:hypothetical protein